LSAKGALPIMLLAFTMVVLWIGRF